MAMINFLRFSDDMGAIVSDDEFWNVHFRKRMHANALHPLLSEEMAEQWKMQVVYGGTGYPAIHKETVEHVIKELADIFNNPNRPHPERVKDVARISFDIFQKTIRRRIDQKMSFYYGFTTEDFHKGSFNSNGLEVPIVSEVIKENARKLSEREQKDTLLKAAMESKAAVFGYDTDGITGYHLSVENSILGYVHEGFETIGSGKYASGLVFGQDFKTKTLMMRKSGYKPAEGVFKLIDSMYLAADHFKEVGGNFNFVILDRRKKISKKTLHEIYDDPARLTSEIVRAYRSELLSKDAAVQLIDQLVFHNRSFAETEKQLFEKSSDPNALMLALRRYKLAEIPIILKDAKTSNLSCSEWLKGGKS